MTLEEFERVVFQTAHQSPLCDIPAMRNLTPTSETIRVSMIMGGFIDAFFNAETGTMAFAFIREGKRVFGADNTGGWHMHPFDDPEEHRALANAMTFADFVKAVEERFVGG